MFWSPGVLCSALVVLAVFASGLLAPVVAPLDPTEQDVIERLTPPVFMPGGTTEHLLGTDHLGRDVLSRLIYGARIALIVGMTTMVGPLGIWLGKNWIAKGEAEAAEPSKEEPQAA